MGRRCARPIVLKKIPKLAGRKVSHSKGMEGSARQKGRKRSGALRRETSEPGEKGDWEGREPSFSRDGLTLKAKQEEVGRGTGACRGYLGKAVPIFYSGEAVSSRAFEYLRKQQKKRRKKECYQQSGKGSSTRFEVSGPISLLVNL